MSLEAALLLAVALAVLAAVAWLALSMKAELRALHGRLDAAPTSDVGATGDKAPPSPRLAAARAAAAERTAKRPGRTTVKRI
jgi:hypothetical protein